MDGSSANAQFEVRQCRRRACRFRFPVALREGHDLLCPRCHGLTDSVSEPFGGRGQARMDGRPHGPPVAALLDNLRSSYNVGSIFRAGDGAGVQHLYLCGITSTPDQPKVVKTALGADQTVPWSYHPNSLDLIRQRKDAGYALWSLENRGPARSIFEYAPSTLTEPILLAVGNERAGVDPGLLKESDQIVSLPMLGHKSSLNAAVAFGIAVYWLRFGARLSVSFADEG